MYIVHQSKEGVCRHEEALGVPGRSPPWRVATRDTSSAVSVSASAPFDECATLVLLRRPSLTSLVPCSDGRRSNTVSLRPSTFDCIRGECPPPARHGPCACPPVAAQSSFAALRGRSCSGAQPPRDTLPVGLARRSLHVCCGAARHTSGQGPVLRLPAMARSP